MCATEAREDFEDTSKILTDKVQRLGTASTYPQICYTCTIGNVST